MRPSSLEEAHQRAADLGFNLFGLVDARRFDASQPKERRTCSHFANCGTVIVLGSAGRSFWRRWSGACGPAVALGRPSGIDHFVRDSLCAIERLLRARAIVVRSTEYEGSRRLSLARLGEAAGFGTVSPVTGLLLHPEFGPWVRVRGALLVEGCPFGPVADASISDRFQPCCGCSRPCVSACPAGVHDGFGGQDLGRCAEHRHGGNCSSGCSSRSACPIGAEHHDGPGEDAHRHTFSLPTVQRWFGLGFWRYVPRFLRRPF